MNKEEKKQKRYLYDLLDKVLSKKLTVVIVIIFFILGVIILRNYHTPIHTFLGTEPQTKTYSNEERKQIYEKLYKVSETVIKEDEGIFDIKLIPKGVKYSITNIRDDYTQEDGNTKFYYYLEDFDERFFNMTIILSEKNVILDKKCNMESESQTTFEKSINVSNTVENCLFSAMWMAILVLGIFTFCFIIQGISYLHKKLDEKKKQK